MATMQPSEWGQKWGQIVSRACADESFRKRLTSDPSAVLREEDVEIPPGVQVRILENTDQVLYLTLPPRSSTQELSEADLSAIAGGMAAPRRGSSDRA